MRELEALEAAFARACAGHGQVVFVVGEPGIGKSRLLYEFRGRSSDADWREGHCLSFGRATAFHPLVDLLKRWVGIDERDADDVAVTKLERAVAAIGDDVRAAAPYLRYLLSLGPADAAITALDPRERRGGIFEALRRMILRAARAPAADRRDRGPPLDRSGDGGVPGRARRQRAGEPGAR